VNLTRPIAASELTIHRRLDIGVTPIGVLPIFGIIGDVTTMVKVTLDTVNVKRYTPAILIVR
jgi:hypothetical protein